MSEGAASKGVVWVRHSISAHEIEVGDRLDSSGRTRVVLRHPRTDLVLVKTQTTGARTPNIATWPLDEQIFVWRKA